MREERRRHRRVAGSFEGRWDGLLGPRDCRITEISAGGCFVDTFSLQDAGTRGVVTVAVAGERFSLPGKVVHIDAVQGFSVQFDQSDATRRLAAILNGL
jgi:hypothetical protein